MSDLYLTNACLYFCSIDSDSALLFHFKDAASAPFPVVLAVYSSKYWVQHFLACEIWLACGSWLSLSCLCFWLWEKSLTYLQANLDGSKSQACYHLHSWELKKKSQPLLHFCLPCWFGIYLRVGLFTAQLIFHVMWWVLAFRLRPVREVYVTSHFALNCRLATGLRNLNRNFWLDYCSIFPFLFTWHIFL